MIQTTPLSERPRERCLQAGPSSLSLRECLALILNSGPPGVGALGLAHQILNIPGDGLSPLEEEIAFFTALEGRGNAYLKAISGLGPAGQARILAAFEIGRRYAIHRSSFIEPNLVPLSVSKLATQALTRVSLESRTDSHEWLGFVAFYRSGQIGELCFVERGNRTHVNVDPAELFARILALRPRGFILFHNHPSGSLTPSAEDLDLTNKVERLANQFGIELIGHWIVAPCGEFWIHPKLHLLDRTI